MTAQQPLLGTPVGEFAHMMQRVEARQIEAMILESKEEVPVSQSSSDAPARA